MKIGTKSLLFGAHQFLIHPFFVALAWWRLYGFPWDPRLWIAFFVHDLGYFGSPNMDGEAGKEHPILGAHIMSLLFGQRWLSFCLLHSRYYANMCCCAPSRLCYADKLAICIEPAWLYLPRAWLTGELAEYRAHGATVPGIDNTTAWTWYRTVQAHTKKYVALNKY